MQVVALDSDDLHWPASNASSPSPAYGCGSGSYKRQFYVDPHPCYSHDVARVEDLLASCVGKSPHTEAGNSALYLLAHEFTGRNNGLAFEDPVYKRPDGTDWDEQIKCHCCDDMLKLQGQAHSIVLCGKRIPIMPSMTRYLVTHEYGHTVWNRKRRLLGYTTGSNQKLQSLYMRLRGEPDYKERDNEPWHQLVSEIVANDFRTLVMETECEFWPHEVPMASPGWAIARWWAATTREEMEAVMAEAAPPTEAAA